MDTTVNDGSWWDVPVPNPVERSSYKRGKSVKTRAHEARMIEILKAPPADYDGSNKKLAEYMGLSQRTIIRIMNGLKAEGKVRVTLTRNKSAQLGYFTYRTIQLRSGV